MDQIITPFLQILSLRDWRVRGVSTTEMDHRPPFLPFQAMI